MNNLVERLRANPNYTHWLCIAEAADRIEHLEALEQRLRAAAMEDFDRIADLEEENERLQARVEALEGAAEEEASDG